MISFLDGRVVLYPGDCLEILAAMPENSVDAACMDPPYHLTSIVDRFGKGDSAEVKAGATGAYVRASAGFMGKQWDGGDIAFQVDTWKAVYRVLKPGAYILAFASTRGFGRMSVAIEDAGFITHPLIAWVFGSGFPKATRIKAEGYDGFRYGGQALKPAIEPIYMGQKPFSEQTGTANILKHGTGAINIDGCRVGWPDGLVPEIGTPAWGGPKKKSTAVPGQDGVTVDREGPSQSGRWPANLIHDGSDDVLAAFPSPHGAGKAREGSAEPRQQNWSGNVGNAPADRSTGDMHRFGDSGSAARFFYSAKADSNDRIGSKHPTVKPVDLMRYLVRLITPPGGTVLDCFAGTGTTGAAAWREGLSAILIEREPEYQADIAERMRFCLSGPDEKRREIIKRRGLADDDAGPLFGDTA